MGVYREWRAWRVRTWMLLGCLVLATACARARPGSDPTQGALQVADAAEAGLPEADDAPGWPAWLGDNGPAGTRGVRPGVAGLEARLMSDVAADDVGSVAGAVVVGDSVVWMAAFGTADRERGTLAAPGTIYRVGSIGKTVTALALLALAEQGVVGLDDDVEPHVPELRWLANRSPDHRPITFRDLASHAAGLAREPGTSYAGRGPVNDWRRSLLAAIPATEMLAGPGDRYLYSNVGYALLGLAMERAAGRPYEALVRELVLEPLGMTRSYLVVPRAERRRLAAGYVNPAPDSIDPRVPRAEHRGRGYRVPSDGLYSTAADLARLAMAMTGSLGDVPVSAASRAVALAPHSEAYGLGFQLHRIGDTVIAGHSAAVPGYTAYLALDPASRTAVVLLRNYNHGRTNLAAVAESTISRMKDEG
jgi:CubicO group peptidase (beta-lactamase class C family)